MGFCGSKSMKRQNLSIKTSTKHLSTSEYLEIEKIFKLLQEQQPCYSNIKYLNKNDANVIVFQATKNHKEEVKLEIRQYNSLRKGERIQEQGIFNELSKSEYFVEVKNIFDLNSNNGIEFEVIEINYYQLNLRQLLFQLKSQKIDLSNREKEIMLIQMLDAVNLLHSKNILHKNISIESFFVSASNLNNIKYVLKLGQFRPQIYENVQKSEEENYSSLETSKSKYKKETDLQQIGKILFELDNDLKLDSTTQQLTFIKSQKLKSSSLLSQVTEILLDQSQIKKKSARELLSRFANTYSEIPLYSVIALSNVASLDINILNYSEIEKQQSILLKSQLQKSPQFSTQIDNAIQQFSNSKLPQQLTIEQIRRVVTKLLQDKKFTFFSQQSSDKLGVTFSAFNLEQERESWLKISLAEDKSSIKRQIQVMNRCQSPYIIKFYGYQFIIDDNDNTEYVVFELEKCKTTLPEFLKQSQENYFFLQIKNRFAQQILDSVALLHKQNILHGDIKLESFFVSEDEQGREIVKLTDFHQAGILNPHLDFKDLQRKGELIENNNCLFLNMEGSFGYQSPERFVSLNKPITKLSDGFSIGICFLLLDNYISFSSQFTTSYSDLIFPYQKPYQNIRNLLNLESQIYKWAEPLLAYNPAKRLFPNEIVDNFSYFMSPLYSKWRDKLPLEKEYLNSKCLFLRDLCYDKVESFLNSSSISLLITLKLDLNDKKLTSNRTRYLLKCISKLHSLIQLELNLSNNLIGSEGDELFYLDLSSLSFLEYLHLDLNKNQLTQTGAENFLRSISMIKYLSFLTVCFGYNQIRNQGQVDIFSHLLTLKKIQFLNLNLNWNKFTSLGTENIFKSISQMTSLYSLEIQLCNNQIGEDEINIFKHLSSFTNLISLKLNFMRSLLGQEDVANLFEGISKLTALSTLELQLSYNSIGEEIELKNIYEFLTNLTKLTSLIIFLNNSKLKDVGIYHLLQSISKLTSLASLELNLDNNDIKCEGETTLYEDLSNLTKLTSFKLHANENRLSGKEVGNLLKTISSLSSLSFLELNIHSIQIGSEGEKHLYQSLSKLTNLTSVRLNLFGNKLTARGIQNLLKSISTLHSLSSLELRLDNSTIESELEAIMFNKLSVLKLLTTLNLSGKKLSIIGVKNLLKNISKLEFLSSLEFQVGKIEENELHIYSNLSTLPFLSSLTLNFSGTNLTNKGLEIICKSLLELDHLTSLVLLLAYNQIESIIGQENIFEDLQAFTGLTSLKLNLNNNKLTSVGIENLIISISKLSSLSFLEIHLCHNIAIESESKNKLESLFNYELMKINYKSIFFTF